MTDPAPVRATRQAYRDALVALMPRHERVVCLDTDTGLFEGADFGSAGQRYVNIGIAEQNAMGVAAGLAASGWMPFVHTMAAFAAARALEAIKIDIAYNALPVRIAATHGGLAAGHLGPTHHALEDLAVMRTLPNMTVVVPVDAAQTQELLVQSLDLPGPLYLRLGRKATAALPVDAPPPVIGNAQLLRAGRDCVIAACGPHPVHAALAAAQALAADGLDTAVLNLHTVKPFDRPGLLAAASGARLVVTIEDHWCAGGLGAAVAEVLTDTAGRTTPRRLVRVGVPDTFALTVGDHDQLLHQHGVHAAAVCARVRRALQLVRPAPAANRFRSRPTGLRLAAAKEPR